jgi:predicted Zn-dependent protease
MSDTLEQRFRQVLPKADYVSLRYMNSTDEMVGVRQDVPQPLYHGRDAGAMVTVIDKGGMGYAATGDLSVEGLRAAMKRAGEWAAVTAGRSVVDYAKISWPHSQGRYQGPHRVKWESLSLADKYELLMKESRRLKVSDKIVDWDASLWHSAVDSLLLTSEGGRIEQQFSYMAPGMSATANEGACTQERSLGGMRGFCRQGGLEVLDEIGFYTAAPTVGAEAVELLTAANCPTGTMDVLLTPDQMILQIHESIGHPLELDRILGDERNFAGTSFVTLDMFGKYRYGSDLLNISFDPTDPTELASYGYDDDGRPASKVMLIEKGILKRPLGGTTSQARAGMEGASNSRACAWWRAPIDRMANLNLECGGSSMDEMIASVDHGVLMKTNCSWSIDDSRNKFQFGTEWGRLIEGGKLTTLVRNCNYRGISATFWRSLKKVGDRSTMAVMGSPNCGKGEPNQIVRVGHASPACVFGDVEVFGGA